MLYPQMFLIAAAPGKVQQPTLSRGDALPREHDCRLVSRILLLRSLLNSWLFLAAVVDRSASFFFHLCLPSSLQVIASVRRMPWFFMSLFPAW